MWGKPINYQRSDEDLPKSLFLLDSQNVNGYQGFNSEQNKALLSVITVLISSCLIINVKSIEGLSSILNTLNLIPFICEQKNQLKVYVLIRDRLNNSNLHEIQV